MIVRYKINRFVLNSISIPEDSKASDLLNVISTKHKKKFSSVYSYQFKTSLGYNDSISDFSPEDSIYYLSETDKINPDDFINKSNFQILTNMKNFRVQKNVLDDSVKVFEIIQKDSKAKYYAIIFNNIDHFQNIQLFSSILHGAVSPYAGYSPVDFRNNDNSVLLSTLYINGLLSNLIAKKQMHPILDNTRLMIIIYGIASGMAYLNSLGIQNFELSTKRILLDSYLFPKISFYKFQSNDDSFEMSIPTNSPLLFFLEEEIEKSLVLLFSILLYELFTKEHFFNKTNKINISVFMRGKRPSIDSIPTKYQELISACWKTDPQYRPSYDKIVAQLKSDPSFILEGTDKEAYYEYIRLIDEYSESMNEAKDEIISFEKFVSQKSDKFRKYKINKEEDDEESEGETANDLKIGYLNLDNYSKVKLIGEGLYGEVFKVESKDTKEFYSAKISKNKIMKIEENKTNIYREAKIISRLNHPSILKFIGYSPKDFEGESRPVILTEFSLNGSLDQLYELERHNVKIDGWNETKKLINIYGIASCMAYLHSLNIIHRDIKIKNILLDPYLYPKLANFCFSTFPEDYENAANQQNQGIMGNPIYHSPEIFEREEYSKASDVYAFSLIMYEIITGKKPFNFNTILQVMTKVLDGKRPEFDEWTPDCYRNLIEKCWSQDPSKRPSFLDIVEELKTNKDFINDEVDEDELSCYVNYIDEYTKSKEFLSIENFMKRQKISLTKVDLAQFRKKHSEEIKSKISIKYVNLNNFTKQNKIGEGNYGCVYKVIENRTSRIYAGKISKIEINQFDEDLMISHYREVEILSKLNHPCILHFIGYSPLNFENVECPIIITEFAKGGTLSDVLKSERKSLSSDKWNNTTKLINIYGIALSMMYLHQLDIIHRDLKPDNILLDEFLHPKLADFGLSKIISSKNESELNNTSYQLKGTLIYCAPEILCEYKYSKAGDVYAFALIMYEILTNKIPYKNITNIYLLIQEVVTKNNRPSFDSSISQCYLKLIESCWSRDTSKRPTFDKIVDDLKNNPDFLFDDVDEGVFFDYVNHIEEIISRQNRKMNAKTTKNKSNSSNFGGQNKNDRFIEKNKVKVKSSNEIKTNEYTFNLKDKQKIEKLSDSKNKFNKFKETCDQEDIKQNDKEAYIQENSKRKIKETPNQENKMQKIKETPNQENKMQKVEETPNQENKMQKTKETPNQENKMQKTKETPNQENKMQNAKDDRLKNNCTFKRSPASRCCNIS